MKDSERSLCSSITNNSSMEEEGGNPQAPERSSSRRNSSRKTFGEHDHLYRKASESFERVCKHTEIFDHDLEVLVPQFHKIEIKCGRVLGRGGFCVVNEVTEVTLKDHALSTRQLNVNSSEDVSKEKESFIDEKERTEVDHHRLQNRVFMSEKFLRNNELRYAVKTLSPEVLKEGDQNRIYKGIVDLAIEFKFLAVLQHPHIIKMRGVAMHYDDEILDEDGMSPLCVPNFFIILDKLTETLDWRIVKWREKSSNICAYLIDKFFYKGAATKDLWFRRLAVATDLCSAFRHLHSLNIIYRDLKPENIGFDLRDDVKVFDIGLAKELHDKDKLANGLYKLTGFTGSLRYMAPEVFLEDPYDFKADVYSFSILLWYILTLEIPYKNFNYDMYERLVVEGGYRPKLDPSWSDSLQDMLSKSWSEEISERPTIDDVLETLKAEVIKEQGEGVYELDISNKTEKSLHA